MEEKREKNIKPRFSAKKCVRKKNFCNEMAQEIRRNVGGQAGRGRAGAG